MCSGCLGSAPNEQSVKFGHSCDDSKGYFVLFCPGAYNSFQGINDVMHIPLVCLCIQNIMQGGGPMLARGTKC